METERPSNKKIKEEEKYDWEETIQPHLTIAVIGESGCGKSSLILAAKNHIFPHPHEKFVTKLFCVDVEVDGKVETCMVRESNVEDLMGSKIYSVEDDMGSKIYSETNVVLLCFNKTEALGDVEKWFQKLQKNMPNVPIIVVRIKKEEEFFESIYYYSTLKQIEKYSPLMECFPHAKEGVKEVFQEAVKQARKREIADDDKAV
ncbi:hypothetical protein AVEN_191643-1 [Araneus ventricosus]|uniref:Uncharacterized protein n=1 Tax=Araneus ventricosus TaxID=182803 RepID=A0A4Y2MDI6_ARAVE|nr:hypothetical protein AVEN_191643-1 [Araneus ventricosus]